MSRDLLWEAEFRKNVAREVARRYGVSAEPLLALTEHRMGPAIGAAQYGDSTFLTDDRDLLREAEEELADVVAYMNMQIQRELAGAEERGERVAHLFEAAVGACAVFASLRAARRA